MSVKLIAENRWVVSLTDTLVCTSGPSPSGSSSHRVVEIVVEFTPQGFAFRPWRVLQESIDINGKRGWIASPLPDCDAVWDVMVPMARVEFYAQWTSPVQQVYTADLDYDPKQHTKELGAILNAAAKWEAARGKQ